MCFLKQFRLDKKNLDKKYNSELKNVYALHQALLHESVQKKNAWNITITRWTKKKRNTQKISLVKILIFVNKTLKIIQWIFQIGANEIFFASKMF